jgi:hypothetical protein
VFKIGSTTTPATVVGTRSGTGSFTVANDAKAPFVASFDSIKIGALEATFTMSEEVQWSASAATSADLLTHDDIGCGSDVEVVSMAHVSGNTFIAVFTGDELLATETCVIAAAYKDVAGNAATVAKTSAAAVTDTTGSVITAKLTKTVYSGAATGAMGTGGTFKVAALATGAYKGPAGLAWSVQLVAGATTALPVVSVFDAVTAIDGPDNLTAGTATYDIVLTSNEIMGETAADFILSQFSGDADGAGAGATGCAVTQDTADLADTPAASDWYSKVMHITCTADATNELITVGVSQMLAGTDIKDFKGNVMTAAARKIIIQAG